MNNRILHRWLFLLITVQFTIAVQSAEAQKFYFHRQATCNKCCLPTKHRNYSDDKTTGGSVVLCRADPAVESSVKRVVYRRFEEISDTAPPPILIKRFHVPVSAVTADRVALGQIGLAILDTGEAICSGMLDCNGGVDGGLRGTNVTISVRAYAGVAGAESAADAIMVWEKETTAWAWKNRPELVKFGTTGNGDHKLERFFGEITHLELELEYEIDR